MESAGAHNLRARPSTAQRVWFAVAMGIGAALLVWIRVSNLGGLSDFAPVWHGAQTLIHGGNPYTEFGPGMRMHYDWHLYYPLPAMVLAAPLGLLPEFLAAIFFSAVSAGLLAFAVTRDSWDRSWIFFSASFVAAAKASQWAPIIAAAVFLPALGFILVCKPNLGSAVAVSTGSRKLLVVAAISAVVLVGISFIVMPSWPGYWWNAVQTGTELNAPITRAPGFLLALALLRWRQPEARLLLAVACVPQTSSWYETLMPLLVARSKREMQWMVGASGAGYLMQIAMLDYKSEIATTDIGILMIVFVYLPALVIVLRRPNEGELPAWFRLLPQRRETGARRVAFGS